MAQEELPGASDSEETIQNEQALAQRAGLLAFVAKMEALPDKMPPDGFSNRDHDWLIYGSAVEGTID